MEIHQPPDGRDEPNFIYKLQRKIKLFDKSDFPNCGYNLVTASTKYATIFIGTPLATLLVYPLSELVDKRCEEPKHLVVDLPEKPTHIAVNCENDLIAVMGAQKLYIYQISNFQNESVTPSVSMALNTSSFVTSLQWNPCISDTVALVCYDGSLFISKVRKGEIQKGESKGRCVCWSPKGKQLVVGNSDGSITQYKPDLTVAKNIPPPNLFDGSPVETLTIHWISTYQYAVVYKNASDNNSRPCLTIVNTPKDGSMKCINYEDITYSMSNTRPWYYYLLSIPQWNTIMASSSNSMEIGTLGSSDGVNWMQWSQMDECRPELPLTDKKEENYPIGLCIDTCAIHQLPWGENESLPPMPLMHVLSHTGMLTIFNVINVTPSAPQICTAPQPLQLCPTKLVTTRHIEATQASPGPPVQTQQKQQVEPAQVQNPQTFSAPTQPSEAFKPTGLSFGQVPTAAPNITQPPPQAEVKSAFQAPTMKPPPPAYQEPQNPTNQEPPKPQPTNQITAAPQQNNASANQATAAHQKIKAEQEKAASEKANKELREILIKEANDFQKDLYLFRQSTKDTDLTFDVDGKLSDITAKLQAIDPKKLEKDFDLEELKSIIVDRKLEQVRLFAAIAEAKANTNPLTGQKLDSPDPVCARRLSSINKLLYYVQSQLQQAHGSLRHKWDEIDARSPDYLKGRMLRPALDEVYQLLVRQQEILRKQRAMLKTFEGALADDALVPPRDQPSLLRATPFRTKDPLSKLTKNILNMSIEADSNKAVRSCLTPRKLESLKDALANQRTVRIKPVSLELDKHLASVHRRYDRLVKDIEVKEEIEHDVPVKFESKEEPPRVPPIREDYATDSKPRESNVSKITSTPVPGLAPLKQADPTANPLARVTRNIFATDGQNQHKQESIDQYAESISLKQPASVPSSMPMPAFASMPAPASMPTSVPVSASMPSLASMPASAATSTSTQGKPKPVKATAVLAEFLHNKMNADAAKNDGSTFMGQKICGPNLSTTNTAAKAPFSFNPSSKPDPDIGLFGASGKTQPAAPSKPAFEVSSENNKAADDKSKAMSAETGEAETSKDDAKKLDFSAFSLSKSDSKTPVFGMQSFGPPKPEINFGTPAFGSKPDVVSAKLETKTDKPSFTIPGITPLSDSIPPQPDIKAGLLGEKPIHKPIAVVEKPIEKPESENLAPKPTDLSQPETKPVPEVTKTEASKGEEKPFSFLAAANALSSTGSVFGQPTTPSETKPSIFGAQAVSAKTPEATPTSAPPASIFGLPPSPPAEQPSSAAPVQSTASSIFAAANAAITTTSAGGMFGTAAGGSTGISGSIFGLPPSPGGSPSIFGGAQSQQSPQSVFGAPAASPATPTGFGSQPAFPASPPASQAQSVFGAPATQSPSLFGAPEASLFAAASISTTQATSTPANVFASGTTSNVFGGGSVFGGKPSFGAGSGAGAGASPASIFGGGSAFAPQQPAWGSAAAPATGFQSPFSSPKTQASSIFGGGFSPATQSQPFGAPAQQGSIFGSADPKPAGTGLFGSPQQAASPAFGGSPVFGSKPVFGQSTGFGNSPSGFGSFSGGGANVAQSGFGAPAAFGKPASPGGFGASPAFGSPAFGSPGFGSNSPGKMFGASPTSSFAPSQQSSTFESLATQETLTFGNLAQQTQQPAQPAFKTSPSFTGWRG